MAKKITFRGILRSILIGGGTVLAALCPPVGGAVVTAGMAIGAGSVAAGSLITPDNPEKPAVTVDNVTDRITQTMENLGLLQPAGMPTATGMKKGLVLNPLVIGGLILGAIMLIFRPFKRRRK